MTEQEILKQLAEAKEGYKEAGRQMAEVKKRWNECETNLINAKLAMERVVESLRVYHNTTYRKEYGSREKEIKAFQEKYPEVCEIAAERDRNRP